MCSVLCSPSSGLHHREMRFSQRKMGAVLALIALGEHVFLCGVMGSGYLTNTSTCLDTSTCYSAPELGTYQCRRALQIATKDTSKRSGGLMRYGMLRSDLSFLTYR
jgi:hypothetical protein